MRKKTKVPESPRNAEFYSLVERTDALARAATYTIEDIRYLKDDVASLEKRYGVLYFVTLALVASNVITIALFIYSVTR